jgi:hypothetical protein
MIDINVVGGEKAEGENLEISEDPLDIGGNGFDETMHQ